MRNVLRWLWKELKKRVTERYLSVNRADCSLPWQKHKRSTLLGCKLKLNWFRHVHAESVPLSKPGRLTQDVQIHYSPVHSAGHKCRYCCLAVSRRFLLSGLFLYKETWAFGKWGTVMSTYTGYIGLPLNVVSGNGNQSVENVS